MELAEDRLSRSNRRSNAGNRLQELLDLGLGEEEERILEAFSDVSSDSSFKGSDEEAIDLIDSDFSDEEVEGVLEGEVIETDASVRREERKERSETRKRQLQRAQKFTSAANARAQQRANRRRLHRHGKAGAGKEAGGDGDEEEEEDALDYRAVGRLRPAPTMPLADRLSQALARAHAARTAVAEGDDAGEVDASAVRLPSRKRRRARGSGAHSGSHALTSAGMSEEVLERGHVPETWWPVESEVPLTYAGLATHCAAREGWLCSPTLAPLCLAAAQDRVAFAYCSPHAPELFTVNSEGVLLPVDASVGRRRRRHGAATATSAAVKTSKARVDDNNRAPTIGYLLAPPRASWQARGFRSGQSTLALPCKAPVVLSFADLPVMLASSAHEVA